MNRRAGRSLLVGIVVAILLQVGTQACLLPPPVSVEQSQNQRPFVLTEQVKPTQAAVELNLNCDVCKFTLQADDPDEGDAIYTRWFWDYDQSEANRSVVAQNTLNPTGAALRLPDEYAFRPAGMFPSEADNGTTHTLDVLLSDRPYVQDATATPVNRATEVGAGVAVFRWTVRVVRRGTRCEDVQNICSNTPATGAQ